MGLILHVGTKHKSSWSLRPFIALAHTGAVFETRTIWLDHAGSEAELAKITPTGKVPVLEHDGLVIWDSLAICEYLHETFPQAKLWPTDRTQRARARSIAAEMHSGFTALRRDMTMDLLGDKRGQGHTPEALADVRRIVAIWRDQLAQTSGPFLFGELSIADAMFAPVTSRFTTYGVDLDPICRGYVEAIAATPGFVRWKTEAIAEAAVEPAP